MAGIAPEKTRERMRRMMRCVMLKKEGLSVEEIAATLHATRFAVRDDLARHEANLEYAAYDDGDPPTPEQIEERKLEIQKEWPPERFLDRAGYVKLPEFEDVEYPVHAQNWRAA
jgi:transposase